ncbi:unnamed protein product [Phytophthora fragariaefolia]|uniref:Unnamed protein product n=1 Tax=Phytophthora fragariaefolia TaxID=1490495 RepID=A0A9W6XKC3_9STRA|nr:unnamed protein product [Phytophthora fragariaefolia]
MNSNRSMPPSMKPSLISLSVYVVTRGIGCHVARVENNGTRTGFGFACNRGRVKLDPGQSWEHRFVSLASPADTTKSVVVTDAWVGDHRLGLHEVELVFCRQEVGRLDDSAQGTVSSVSKDVALDFTTSFGPTRIYLSVYIATPFHHVLKVENNDTAAGFSFHCDRGRVHLNPGAKWEHCFINGAIAAKTMKSIVVSDAWVSDHHLDQNEVELFLVRQDLSAPARLEACAQGASTRMESSITLDFITSEKRMPIFISVYIATPLHHVLKVENNDTNVWFSFYCNRGRADLGPGESWRHNFVNGATAVTTLKSVVVIDAWVGSHHFREDEIDLRFVRQDVSLPARIESCTQGTIPMISEVVTLDFQKPNQPTRHYLSLYVRTQLRHELKFETNSTEVGFRFICNWGAFNLEPGQHWIKSFFDGATAAAMMKSIVIVDAWMRNRPLLADEIEICYVRQDIPG